MNQVIISGKLLFKPIIRETVNGTKVSNVTIEVKREFRDSNGQIKTDRIDCTLFNGIAEIVNTMCSPGSCLEVHGRLQERKYITRNDEKVFKVEVIATKVIVLN